MEYTAYNVAKIIAQAFRNAPQGVGGVPRADGTLQDKSINALELSPTQAVVAIGGEKGVLAYYATYLEFSEFVGNTSVTNKHKGWVEKVMESTVIPKLMTL